jgi:hypothetical protein
MPPAVRKRAGDQTGRQAEILAEQHAEELKAREAEISLTNQQAVKSQADPIDVSGNPDVDVVDETGDYDDDYLEDDKPAIEAEDTSEAASTAPAAVVTHAPDVHVERQRRTFRVNSAVENMTHGYGKTYNFTPGQKYTADYDVYAHLDSRGLIWH